MIKYSTYVMNITSNEDNTITYTLMNDPYKLQHKHFMMYKTTFPFHKLIINQNYTVISVYFNNVWHFWKAFKIQNEEDVLSDDDLTEFLKGLD